MKLESLTASKFDAFKGTELQETFNIFGGAPIATTYKSGNSSGADCLDYETYNGSTVSNLDGSNVRRCDYNRGTCETISTVRLEPVICRFPEGRDNVEFDFAG